MDPVEGIMRALVGDSVIDKIRAQEDRCVEIWDALKANPANAGLTSSALYDLFDATCQAEADANDGELLPPRRVTD